MASIKMEAGYTYCVYTTNAQFYLWGFQYIRTYVGGVIYKCEGIISGHLYFAEYGTRNTEHGIRNTEYGIRKHGTQNKEMADSAQSGQNSDAANIRTVPT